MDMGPVSSSVIVAVVGMNPKVRKVAGAGGVWARPW